MPTVHLADRRIHVGNHSRALLSGEVHYWRLDSSVWPTALHAARELGLELVSTYVPWNVHEVGPAQHDFSGRTNPRLNLMHFLELARREGLWVILRPGPYIYAEWPHSGVPERTVRWHRLGQRFKAEAHRWMAAVVQAAGPYLATNGGPIVLWQADNEADPWSDVYGAQLGLGAEPGPFQEFLRTRYGHVAELNAAWGTALQDFDAARAVQAPVAGYEARHLDTVRFRHWYAAEVVRWTTHSYRQLGVDVPVVANTYSGRSVQNWRTVQAECDLVGPDLYPTASISNDPLELRQFQDAIRYARTCAPLAFIPEFEAGIWHGWHARVGTLSATHYELIGLAALQAGVHGWNWYMLVNRDNWYMSPFNDLGVARPDLAPTFRELANLFRQLDPPSLDKQTHTAVTFHALGAPDAALLGALHQADIEYDFFDLDGQVSTASLVLYASQASLESAARRRLAEHVERGGTLVCFQVLPSGLDLRPPDGITTAADPQRLRLFLGNQVLDQSSPTAFFFDPPPPLPLGATRIAPRPPTQEGGNAHVLLPVGERLTVGYVAPRGRGRIVVVGLPPSPELLHALHRWLGVRVPVSAATPSIRSALFYRAAPTQKAFVILTNTARQTLDGRLRLDATCGLEHARDLRTGRRYPIVVGELVVEVPAGSGTVVELSGATKTS